MSSFKELIQHIVVSLVDKPEEVRVTQIQDGQNNRVEIRVAKQDLGKVIGKEGQTIRAIRALAPALSPETHDIDLGALE